MTIKRCVVCGEKFQARTNGKSCSQECREKRKVECDREWRQNNPENVLEYDRKWKAANAEKRRESDRKRAREKRAADPETFRAKARKRRDADPEKHRERNRRAWANRAAALNIVKQLQQGIIP